MKNLINCQRNGSYISDATHSQTHKDNTSTEDESNGENGAVIAEIENTSTDQTRDQGNQKNSHSGGVLISGVFDSVSTACGHNETQQKDDSLGVLETEQEVDETEGNKANSEKI